MLLQLLKIAIKRIISRATQPIRTKRADRTFTEALQLFDQGDMPAAERLLRKTIEICPNHARARSNLGSVLWEQNRFEDSIACLKMAVTLDPDLVEEASLVVSTRDVEGPASAVARLGLGAQARRDAEAQ